MRDVADAADVSLKTVSRVVNNEASVRPGLERRVRDAINALGYQPDDRARYLRRTQPTTRSLGFVQLDVTNPFFAAIYRGLEDAAQVEGYLVLAGSSDADPERERALIEAFISRRVDGLVIASGRPDPSLLQAELELGTPIVFIDQDPGIDALDVVRTDHYQGALQATRHLLAHGHKRVAFLGDDPVFFSASERRRAFIDAMAEAGLPTPWVVCDSSSPAKSEAATTELLRQDDRPTALFTAQNFVTIGAVRALHRLGLQHEVALIGFDDVAMAELVDPQITVVPQDPASLGTLAAERLFARLRGEDHPPERVVQVPELIARGSGEIPPYIA